MDGARILLHNSFNMTCRPTGNFPSQFSLIHSFREVTHDYTTVLSLRQSRVLSYQEYLQRISWMSVCRNRYR